MGGTLFIPVDNAWWHFVSLLHHNFHAPTRPLWLVQQMLLLQGLYLLDQHISALPLNLCVPLVEDDSPATSADHASHMVQARQWASQEFGFPPHVHLPGGKPTPRMQIESGGEEPPINEQGRAAGEAMEGSSSEEQGMMQRGGEGQDTVSTADPEINDWVSTWCHGAKEA